MNARHSERRRFRAKSGLTKRAVVGRDSMELRISDLLELRAEHFLDDHQRIRQRFWIKEQKKGMRQEVVINDSIRQALEEYLAAYPEIIGCHKHFIFFNSEANGFRQPKRRGQSWKVITSICRQVGLRGNFATHSLRKTWGYHARMQGVDLALIMHKLDHESISYTRRYLGITDDELQAVSKRLNL